MVLVAAAQVAPVFLDLDGSLAVVERLIGEAGRAGVKLLVFGETWLSGYPVWIDNAPGSATWDSADAKALFRRLFENSPEIDSPEIRRLCAAAKEASVMVVMGMNERDGGTLFNTMLYVSESGNIVGKHRKLVPTYTERLIHGMGDGSTLTVVDSPVLGRVGGLVCWEHWMPLTRQAMHAQREVVHAAVWPTVNEAHQIGSRSYAFEGRTFVVAVGTILRREHLPPPGSFKLLDEMEGDVYMSGGSAIIGPDGKYIAGPAGGDVEGLVIGEIDPGRATEELQTLDINGHYARPDVFTLEVNTRANELVVASSKL